MSSTYATFTSSHRPLSRLNQAVDVLRRWWWAYWLHRSQRATVIMLSSLDPRVLRDIGIDRSEIDSVVYGRAGERLRAYSPPCR
jgi:uncharacterized protein YjiS (DUF1127 family)